jgi:hypothetical protein
MARLEVGTAAAARGDRLLPARLAGHYPSPFATNQLRTVTTSLVSFPSSIEVAPGQGAEATCSAGCLLPREVPANA